MLPAGCRIGGYLPLVRAPEGHAAHEGIRTRVAQDEVDRRRDLQRKLCAQRQWAGGQRESVSVFEQLDCESVRSFGVDAPQPGRQLDRVDADFARTPEGEDELAVLVEHRGCAARLPEQEARDLDLVAAA